MCEIFCACMHALDIPHTEYVWLTLIAISTKKTIGILKIDKESEWLINCAI